MTRELRALLWHTEGSVRAKVCNLLGNLCKHSDTFLYTFNRIVRTVSIQWEGTNYGWLEIVIV